MLTKFIIFTTPRVGSTFLRLWINSHPEIRCHGEIFLRHYNAKDGYKEFCQQTTGQKVCYSLLGNKFLSRVPGNYYVTDSIRKYLSALYHDPSHPGPWTDITTWNEYQPNSDKWSCVGFKIMKSTMSAYPALKKIVTEEHYKIILLRRENVLNTYLSRLSLKKSGVAHSQNNIVQDKHLIDTSDLIRQLEKIADENKSLERIFRNNPMLLVSYEEMFNDPTGTSRRIQDYLGVEYCILQQPKLKKINPLAMENRIDNYREFCAALRSTKFEKYIN